MGNLNGNRYANPYANNYMRSAAAAGSTAQYRPFNGALQAPYTPAASPIGSEIAPLTFAGVPADLSLLTFNAPDGAAYTFQFVRAGSVASAGIPVAVPAGGGTAAQNLTALLLAISLGSGVNTGGRRQYFPFSANPLDATHAQVFFTTPGPIVSVTVPANITATLAQVPVNYGSTCPGRAGMVGATLTG